jgi:hypothetical protein
MIKRYVNLPDDHKKNFIEHDDLYTPVRSMAPGNRRDIRLLLQHRTIAAYTLDITWSAVFIRSTLPAESEGGEGARVSAWSS